MVRRIPPLLIMVILLLIGHPALAAGPSGDGQIQGTIVNKTSGGTSSVGGQLVTLNIFQGTSALNSSTVQTGVDGKYSFSGLSTDASYTYEVDITYQGADYYSDPLQFVSGETSITADIGVNDTTSTDEAISITLAHVVLTQDSNGLNVTQYYDFANSGDRAYIGLPSSTAPGKNETVKMTLPQRAANFQVAYGMTDTELIKNGNSLIDTVPVTPAGREISFSYTLPSTASLAWTFNYDVTRFDILTSDPSIKLTGDKLTAEQPLNINGGNYQDYSSENLVRGDTVSAVLSAASVSSLGHFNWEWLLLIPIVGVVGAIGIVAAKRRRDQPEPSRLPSNNYPDLKEKLLNEIAALDDSFEDGKIDRKEYERLRSEKKRKLATLTEVMQEVRLNKD